MESPQPQVGQPYTVRTESLDFMDPMLDYRLARERAQSDNLRTPSTIGQLAAKLFSKQLN